ncbi:hypothetical protein Pcinc_004129 [Petrolisthes cinctipes]|uniref:Uncharacterized protein n=1 Tax=Petrolisthes cinctipes TaxID=88211 RepID=A0AAE1GFB0_PETCI|nr:hypothetical protein Pcinc_004129 [Petrolisthes cinctipes]
MALELLTPVTPPLWGSGGGPPWALEYGKRTRDQSLLRRWWVLWRRALAAPEFMTPYCSAREGVVVCVLLWVAVVILCPAASTTHQPSASVRLPYTFTAPQIRPHQQTKPFLCLSSLVCDGKGGDGSVQGKGPLQPGDGGQSTSQQSNLRKRSADLVNVSPFSARLRVVDEASTTAQILKKDRSQTPPDLQPLLLRDNSKSIAPSEERGPRTAALEVNVGTGIVVVGGTGNITTRPPSRFPRPRPLPPVNPSRPRPLPPVNPSRPRPIFPVNPSRPRPIFPVNPSRPRPIFPVNPSRPRPLPPVNPSRPRPLPPVNPSRPRPLPPVNPSRPRPLPPVNPSRPRPLPPVNPSRPRPPSLIPSFPRPLPPSVNPNSVLRPQPPSSTPDSLRPQFPPFSPRPARPQPPSVVPSFPRPLPPFINPRPPRPPGSQPSSIDSPTPFDDFPIIIFPGAPQVGTRPAQDRPSRTQTPDRPQTQDRPSKPSGRPQNPLNTIFHNPIFPATTDPSVIPPTTYRPFLPRPFLPPTTQRPFTPRPFPPQTTRRPSFPPQTTSRPFIPQNTPKPFFPPTTRRPFTPQATTRPFSPQTSTLKPFSSSKPFKPRPIIPSLVPGRPFILGPATPLTQRPTRPTPATQRPTPPTPVIRPTLPNTFPLRPFSPPVHTPSTQRIPAFLPFFPTTTFRPAIPQAAADLPNNSGSVTTVRPQQGEANQLFFPVNFSNQPQGNPQLFSPDNSNQRTPSFPLVGSNHLQGTPQPNAVFGFNNFPAFPNSTPSFPNTSSFPSVFTNTDRSSPTTQAPRQQLHAVHIPGILTVFQRPSSGFTNTNNEATGEGGGGQYYLLQPDGRVILVTLSSQNPQQGFNTNVNALPSLSG